MSLIEAAELREELVQQGAWPPVARDELRRFAVVDCRFTLGDPGAGLAGYERGHIPGATFMALAGDLAAPAGGADGGRHPLPSAAAFERSASRAGISAGSQVVAYDEHGEGGAARLWWLLRHFGHDAATVLNGGLRAWLAAGGELEAGPPPAQAGDFRAEPRNGDTVSAEEIAGGGLRLLDARAPERFRGDTEPIDPVAGHIPGALNVPFAELAPGGHFPPADALRERLGTGGFVAYCGSGVTASALVFAAHLAGVPARLYPGSWSEWCSRGLPAETG